MSIARKLAKPVASRAAVWAGRKMMAGVQKRTAKSVTDKGGKSVSRKGLAGILIAVLSAAALAALKVGVDNAMSDRKDRRKSEFDVFADDED